MININERHLVFEKLQHLKSDTPPVFGKMTAQHMVEHLLFVVEFCNGKKPQELMVPQQKANIIKHYTVETDREMSIGFKAPMLGDEPMPLLFPDLITAIQQLEIELNNFDAYFKNHPEAKPMSPVLGELDHTQWIIFHNKHFTHHFKQFGLV